MAQISVLLVDNHPDYLKSCSELLSSNGYRVFPAISPAAALEILENIYIHIAILDMRLIDDTDDKDKSGLLLAKEISAAIPKIMLTRYPTYRDVVDALKPDAEALPPAVDFVDKRDELDVLLTAVNHALSQYVKINHELVIHWESLLSFPQIVRLIELDLTDELLSGRSVELEDLFRKLFYKSSQITLGDIFSYDNGRVILPVYAFDQNGVSQQYIISCGQKTVILNEKKHYETTIPLRTGIANIGELKAEETVHFSAIAYAFMGNDLEETETLRQTRRSRPLPDVLAAITHLYEKNLGDWYRRGRSQHPPHSLLPFYHEWLNLEPFIESKDHLQEKIKSICRNALAVNLVHIEWSPSQLIIHLPDADVRSYLNPAAVVNKQEVVGQDEGQWSLTHGNINVDTVLVDQLGRSWLTDFARVGRAPILRDFVSLETAVKLDLLRSPDFQQRCQVEQRLLQATELKDDINKENLRQSVSDVLQIVERIRHMAGKMTGWPFDSYQGGLFFCALGEIIHYDIDTLYTRRALAKHVHALFTATILADKLAGKTQATVPTEAINGLWIDKNNKIVWVEGKTIDLTMQEFKILKYLYERTGQLCERKTIVEEGLNEKYDEFDPEQSRLNSAMSRLRQKIETDPRKPKYLFTVRGYGYKLMA